MLGLFGRSKRIKDFKKAVALAASDGSITDFEESELKSKLHEWGLEESLLAGELVSKMKEMAAPIISRCSETLRMSPEDEAAIQSIGTQLKLDFHIDGEMGRLRRLWQLENSPELALLPITAGIIITKNEQVYLHVPGVSWKRMKRVKKRHGYAGSSVNFRVAKGVSFRLGHIEPITSEYETVQTISDGEIFVTNKKLIFVGIEKSTNITMGRIASFDRYSDALSINKTSGNPDIFSMNLLDQEEIVLTIAAINRLN